MALSAYCAVQLERALRFHRSFCIKQTHPVKFVRWGRQGVAVGRVWSTCGVDRFNFLSKFKYICVCFCAVCMCVYVCVCYIGVVVLGDLSYGWVMIESLFFKRLK